MIKSIPRICQGVSSSLNPALLFCPTVGFPPPNILSNTSFLPSCQTLTLSSNTSNSVMDSESFTYSTIPPGRNFRLLKIFPGYPGDPLVCELFVSTLDDATPYTALSYVWEEVV